MPMLIPDRYTVMEGEKLLVHYYGFTPNATAYIAWMAPYKGHLANIYNAAGEFTVSSSGNGVVEITTTQGGKEIPPGKYWLYMWDTGGKSALAGPIEVISGRWHAEFVGTFGIPPKDIVPIALAAGLGIGSYILTKKPTVAVAGAAVGGIGGWFLTNKLSIPKKK